MIFLSVVEPKLGAGRHLDIVALFPYKGRRFFVALAFEEQFVGYTAHALRLNEFLVLNRNDSVFMENNGSSRTDAFTRSCRDFIGSLTYEAILAFTVYAAPMLFMIGPAAIVDNRSPTIIVLQSLLGFGMSWTIHRMGHRLLSPLPKGPRNIHLSPRLCLPVKLGLGQFIWLLEILVAAAVFCGMAGKRFFAEDVTLSVLFLALGCLLYFLPVYLTQLWSKRYYPVLTLLSPTDDVINKSVPSLRSFFQR